MVQDIVTLARELPDVIFSKNRPALPGHEIAGTTWLILFLKRLFRCHQVQLVGFDEVENINTQYFRNFKELGKIQAPLAALIL